jgi:hypothetical protein
VIARVIPVLGHGASMPSSSELPDSLRELAFKNAVIVRDDPDFHRDMTHLIEQIKAQTPQKRMLSLMPIMALLVTVVIVIGVVLMLIQSGGNSARLKLTWDTFLGV